MSYELTRPSACAKVCGIPGARPSCSTLIAPSGSYDMRRIFAYFCTQTINLYVLGSVHNATHPVQDPQ